MRKIPLIAATLVALPGLALAWTPYGPVPYGYPEPAPYSMPFYGSAGPGYPGSPGSVPQPPGVPDAQSAPSVPEARVLPQGIPQRSLPLWPRLEIRRAMQGGDYVVDVLLQNIEPDAVEIHPSGNALVIRYGTERHLDRQNERPDGSYSHRYSVSRGSASRRVGLPGDADLNAMSTEIEDGRIQIRIPRAANPNAGWPSPSARH
ncbi:Hsp20/alpha crystallin family protein [Imhoffiella purpurea]|uniref:SHSP domain-containing protein n=1 Tax=Imhoffiella purpurea TaxID=1249627 RepID=W9V1F5_9GAMM|nr:Hsp20/alpha crystallin family protein [Imhoffiella purpurea]EXJ13298.1 hypothetical protein D779_3889 [Imhoffiella purpurea]